MRIAALTFVIKVGGRFQQRTENIHKLADNCNEGLQRIEPRAGKPPSNFSKKTQHTTLYETGTHIRDRIAYKVEE